MGGKSIDDFRSRACRRSVASAFSTLSARLPDYLVATAFDNAAGGALCYGGSIAKEHLMFIRNSLSFFSPTTRQNYAIPKKTSITGFCRLNQRSPYSPC